MPSPENAAPTPASPAAAKTARLVRRALARRAAAEAPVESELNIVPFLDIVTNLLLFLLATVGSVMIVTQVDAQLPRTRPHVGGTRAAPPTVSVTLVRSGIVVAGPGGFAVPGCERSARAYATAVPRAGARYDFEALSACVERVHDALSEPSDQIVVGADPDVPYEDVLRAIDAVRARGARPLFPDVLISAGVR